MRSLRLTTATAVKCGVAILAAMAVLAPGLVVLRGGGDGELVRAGLVSAVIMTLGATMLRMLAAPSRGAYLDAGLSPNPFSSVVGVQGPYVAKAPAQGTAPTALRESSRPERSSVATRLR